MGYQDRDWRLMSGSNLSFVSGWILELSSTRQRQKKAIAKATHKLCSTRVRVEDAAIGPVATGGCGSKLNGLLQSDRLGPL